MVYLEHKTVVQVFRSAYFCVQ